MLDLIRLDHFRGFEAYYEIPAGEVTAVNGAWVKGPGAPFFAALQGALGDLPIIAENLGVITPEVEALRKQFDLPGHGDPAIRLRQRSAGPRFQAAQLRASSRCLHRHARQRHRRRLVEQQSRVQAAFARAEDVEKEMAYARRYLNTDGSDINWVMIRTLMASVADTVLFPLQDVLGVGSEGRMNLPGTLIRQLALALSRGQLDGGSCGSAEGVDDQRTSGDVLRRLSHHGGTESTEFLLVLFG